MGMPFMRSWRTGFALVLAWSCGGPAALSVDDNAPPGGDEQTWSTAWRFLQDALLAARRIQIIGHLRRFGRTGMRRDRDRVALLVGVVRLFIAAAILCAFAAGEASAQCEILKLTKPDGEGGDLFGAVALDGDVAVMADATALGGVGEVYVSRFDGAQWVWEAKLTTPHPCPESNFTRAAIEGDVIVVGDPGAEVLEFQQGAAYVFRYEPSVSEWLLEASLTASDGDYNDLFGYSVAISGDVIVIGAAKDEEGDIKKCGSAYIFRRVGNVWAEEARLLAPDPMPSDALGVSASARAEVVLIGASARDTAGPNSGAAFIFRYDGETWNLEAELTAFDASGAEWYGWSVALGPDVAMIGAPFEDLEDGAAYVYRFDGAQWRHEVKLQGSNPVAFPLFGWYVALDEPGRTALIAAPHDDTVGFEAGAAYVFRMEDTGWKEIVKLLPSDPQGLGQFGGGPVSGDVAFIGAAGQSESPGMVYVYAGMTGTDCNHNGEPDACDIFDGTSEDVDGDGIPDECEGWGDLNGDGVVDVLDLLLLLEAWGPCDPPCPPACDGDTDGDCVVDVLDLLEVLSHWSPCA